MTNLAEPSDDARQTQPGFLIVGLGASPGGVEALREFFAHVPADSGIAYVVILHLSPEHDSHLETVLQAVTPIPVTQVIETLRVEPNHVYVVSPNQHLTMVDGELTVSPNTLPEERQAPVDIFFRTLAETHQGRAVCVVLSGTGADGSMGLKRVKERGGVVIIFFDITERKRAEAAVEEDLKDTEILRALSARLVTEEDFQTLYQEITSAAIALTHADAGTVQLLDEDSQELVLLAAQGFEPNMTEHFSRVNASSNTSCGMALANNQRSFVDFDVPESRDPHGSMRMHVEAGYLSAQSTPLVTRSGKPIGMFSTHWGERRRPTERKLRFLDLLARQAADLIEQRQSEQALRVSEARFRTLADAVPQVIWANDADGKAIYFNQRWYDYSGLGYEESVGPGWQAISTPATRPPRSSAGSAPWRPARCSTHNTGCAGRMACIAGTSGATCRCATVPAALPAGSARPRISRTSSRPRRPRAKAKSASGCWSRARTTTLCSCWTKRIGSPSGARAPSASLARARPRGWDSPAR